MMKVGQLVKTLSSSPSLMSPVRLTLYNYLVGQAASEDPVTGHLIQGFLDDCLDYPHWYQHRSQLAQDVKEILKKCLSEEDEFKCKLSAIHWPNKLQVVELEFNEDLQAVVHSYMARQNGPPFRLIQDQQLKKLLALVLHPNGDLEIQFFDRKFLVRDGELRPLKSDRVLVFNSSLDLQSGVVQKADIAPYVTARFISRPQEKDEYLTGSVVRGYIFQRFHDLDNQRIEGFPKLFYFLKRIESHFLRRESNPFYIALTTDIERCVQLLRIGDGAAISRAPELILRSQNACEYVFTSDKLLELLLKDLRNTYQKAESQSETEPCHPTAFDLTNSSPSAV